MVRTKNKTPRSLGALNRVTQVKVRLPEVLRRHLEREAASNGRSTNAEIVRRLAESFRVLGKTTLIASAIYDGLDDAVLEKVVEIYLRNRAEDDLADAMRDEAQIEEAVQLEEAQNQEGSE